MHNAFVKTFIILLALQLSGVRATAQTSSPVTAKAETNNSSSYTLQYQRWGYLGFYHVGLKISMKSGHSAPTTWFINGSGDTSYICDNFFIYQIPAVFPVFMRGYINSSRPTSSILNIRKWENFGNEIPISQDAAMQILAFAQNGTNNVKTYMYSPVIIPFSIASSAFYTSNSYVASIIHWENESGQPIPFPTDGIYIGFDGPYIPKKVFEGK